MNSDIESCIRKNLQWHKLPAHIKQILGNSQKEYERCIVQFSIKNQLRFKGNLIKTLKKEEKRYYQELLRYSQEHLMLYPYHLSDVVVKGLRVTPFAYYVNMMADIMSQEKSYDALPNFTAADCLRLLGIGRNQYIDLMNQCRSSKKFFRRKPPRDLLPSCPVDSVTFEPWWIVSVGFVTEDDIRMCTPGEKNIVDSLIDADHKRCGELDYTNLFGLYKKGLVYIDVPISDENCIIVPPLEGFVMNRVLGDYFETLLYKIFVSIDEYTTVEELANVLQIDLQLVKNAVSMYCRLGFAKKKGTELLNIENQHQSWKGVQPESKKMTSNQIILDWDEGEAIPEANSDAEKSPPETVTETDEKLEKTIAVMNQNVGSSKRIALLFDSTLTAFLMMGNLSPGLKSHAVTMFEVGKLSDESLDSFLNELEKVGSEAEGEARRYFVHALTLRNTLRFLRYNKNLTLDPEEQSGGLAVDLLRCESLLSLDPATRSRVLNKNYSLLVSMAPLSYEIRPVSSCTPQHIGPAIPEVNSVWFKLYMYSLTRCGPPSLLLIKGTRLKKLPQVFYDYEKLLVTTWGHDPGIIATSNILLTLNDALTHSAVFVQAHGWQSEGRTANVSFPLNTNKTSAVFSQSSLECHPAIQSLKDYVDLEHACGYITLLNTGKSSHTVFQDEDCHDFLSEDGMALGGLMMDGMATEGLTMDAMATDPLIDGDDPINGITNETSKQTLASELDMLDLGLDGGPARTDGVSSGADGVSSGADRVPPDVPFQQLKENLTLDLGCEESVHVTNPVIDNTHESDWVLLECYFGIPLFNSTLNQDICTKIISHKLFSESSLRELLESSRSLSLKLLHFIATFQIDVSTSAIGDLMHGNQHDNSTVFPSHNLIFNDGVLEKWKI